MKLLIECKRYAGDNKVGVSFVRSLYGVKIHDGATKAILATTSTFTKAASELVTSHRWELEGRDYDGVVDWVKQARNITRRSKFGLWGCGSLLGSI
jgi:HJR/Mrr/RecB family endonuclease